MDGLKTSTKGPLCGTVGGAFFARSIGLSLGQDCSSQLRNVKVLNSVSQPLGMEFSNMMEKRSKMRLRHEDTKPH